MEHEGIMNSKVSATRSKSITKLRTLLVGGVRQKVKGPIMRTGKRVTFTFIYINEIATCY